MSERYSRIFSLPDNLYVEASPVVISAGALLKDNETSRLLAQLKLQNITNRTIKMVKVALTCLDAVGRPLGDAVLQEYLDLDAKRGDEFGSKTPIKIPYSATRSYSACVIEVGFVDNSVWSNINGVWESIPKQKSITDFLNDTYVLVGYHSVFGSHADYKVLEYKNLWICTCGKINHAGETHCHHCNASLKDLQSLSEEELRNKGIWTTAMHLYETDDIASIEKAKKLFEGISGDEEAVKYIHLCDEKIQTIKERKNKANAKRNKIIKLISIISAAVIALGLLLYFVVYPLVAKANENYKVIINVYNIKEFEIPEGTKEIKSFAFSGCTSLTSITIPDSVTSIGSGAFYNCSSLTSITIPDSVTSIGDEAFYYCSSLTSVTIGNGVTSIGDRAFLGCDSLTSITIPDTVTSIGEWAFAWCSSLTSITIPDTVTSIGDSAFRGCSSLESMTIPFVGGSKTATSASESTLFGYIFGTSSYNGGVATKQYYASGSYKTYYIPSSLTSVTVTGGNILYCAFDNCKNLSSISIGNDVTSIGSYAFSNCTSLTSVTIGNSVTSIGDDAFYKCSSLTSITIPDGVTSIGSYAFYKCSSLTGVTIPNSVTSIGDSAFDDCDSLNSVTIPESVTSIGYQTFSGCSSLTSITIPDSVTSIGRSAFSSCSSLTSIVIPDSVTSIGDYAFYKCSSLTSVTIGNGVKSIGKSAFSGCSSLTSIVIPDTVTSIGDEAFYNCSKLTSVTISNGVKSIGKSAFSGCSSLTSIAIPDTVTSIGSSAFSGCSALQSMTIPFVGGSKTATSASESTLFGYIFGTSSYKGGVATYQSYASYYSYITYYIPASLKSVTITGGNILDRAFYNCDRLTSITIGNAVTSIGYAAFENCDSLTSVTIGNGVTSIGSHAFYNCSSLTSIKYRGTQAEWNAISKGSYWNLGSTGNYTITYNYTGK